MQPKIQQPAELHGVALHPVPQPAVQGAGNAQGTGREKVVEADPPAPATPQTPKGAQPTPPEKAPEPPAKVIKAAEPFFNHPENLDRLRAVVAVWMGTPF